jgi:hypothetical protein
MFYVLCPFCHIGIEIFGTDAGPDCTEFRNVGHCPECDEAFFFDAREVIREPQPEATSDVS